MQISDDQNSANELDGSESCSDDSDSRPDDFESDRPLQDPKDKTYDLSPSEPFPSFEWDSELDFSDHLSSDDTDSDSDASSTSTKNKDRDEYDKYDVDDEDGPEPWNAVCVVGLRVYSTLGSEKAKLRVVRSSDTDDEGDGK